MQTRLVILRAGLVIWFIWHLAFAYLSTFAPQLGADVVGWSSPETWSDELIAMSQQYGMVMVLLAGVYMVMLIDPIRYLGLIWIAVGEQALGIAYGLYIYTSLGQLTQTQLITQVAINFLLICGMIFLWLGLHRKYQAQGA